MSERPASEQKKNGRVAVRTRTPPRSERRLVADAEATAASLAAAREGYRPLAARGALLYFAAEGMGALHAMYAQSVEPLHDDVTVS